MLARRENADRARLLARRTRRVRHLKAKKSESATADSKHKSHLFEHVKRIAVVKRVEVHRNRHNDGT